MTLANKVQQFSDDADKLHAVVHGPASGAGSTVDTEGGARRTLAKMDADLQGGGFVAQVQQGVADAQTAKTQAEAARDAANTSGRAYTSAQGTAAAMADGSVAIGQSFAVLAADVLSFTVYRKDAGPVATLLFTQHTKAYLDALVSRKQRRGWIFNIQGATGKLGMGLNSKGRLILGIGGDILASIQANAAAVAANVTSINAQKAALNPSRRGNAIFRVTDKLRTKAALEISRTGRMLVLGRDMLSELDVVKAAVAALSSFRSRVSRGGSLAIRDAAGKAPFLITRKGRALLLGRDVLNEVDALKASAANTVALDAVRALVLPGKNIYVVGDSLSASGDSWANTITAALTDAARTVTNQAIGGQTSSQQVGRLGARPFLITFAANKILAVGSTQVSASQQLMYDGVLDPVFPISVGGQTWRARVAGVVGTFSSTSGFDAGGYPTGLVFTPDAGQVIADKSVDAYSPASPVEGAVGHEYDLLLVGIGRNNWGTDDVARRIEIVKQDLLAVRDHFQQTAIRKMIVVTPPNRYKNPATGVVYPEGSDNAANFSFFTALEVWAQQTFGECAVVSRTELMRHAAAGNADDAAAIALGCVPPSLTTDGLHWSTTGHTYIRALVAAIINRKGW